MMQTKSSEYAITLTSGIYLEWRISSELALSKLGQAHKSTS